MHFKPELAARSRSDIVDTCLATGITCSLSSSLPRSDICAIVLSLVSMRCIGMSVLDDASGDLAGRGLVECESMMTGAGWES